MPNRLTRRLWDSADDLVVDIISRLLTVVQRLLKDVWSLNSQIRREALHHQIIDSKVPLIPALRLEKAIRCPVEKAERVSEQLFAHRIKRLKLFLGQCRASAHRHAP